MIKQIPYQPAYAISDDGRVYSVSKAGLKELRKDISNGYARVKLSGKKYYVACLVADAFMRPQPDYNFHLFYINGDTTDCSVENLTWLSQSDIKRYSQYTIEYRREMLKERRA